LSMIRSALGDKRILLGVTGSIAAYKAAEFVRFLRQEKAVVTVVLTEAGARFITPLTLEVLSGNKVFSDLFASESADRMPHITLARESDLVLIAPATAQTISRLASGAADTLLSAVVLATRAKVIICPAMNSDMYGHPATQKNLARLMEYGYQVVAPESGCLACGDEGPGRLAGWGTLREAILAAFVSKDLYGRTVLVSAGPTREPLDPVRYLSNRSSGKMGYALARTAKRRGARVILVSGPTSLPPPPGVELVNINTALEMREAIFSHLAQSSAIVMTAAVADYRPFHAESHKIKKKDAGLTLPLLLNPDILAELGEVRKNREDLFLVGFAAESDDILRHAAMKLRDKNLDLLAINDITRSDTGFDTDTNQVTLLDRAGQSEELPLLTKEEVADIIWDRVAAKVDSL